MFRERIVFENASWCLVDKPAGVLSVPSRTGEDDVRLCLGTELQTELGARLWPTHRLDFEVSGLLLFAKTSDAHRDANGWFERELIRKAYVALSASTTQTPDPRLHAGFAVLTPPPEGETRLWSAPIVRGKRRSFVAAHGKEARTRASWTKHAEGRIWQLEPLTGRSHQLRVHMALAGFPILGDVLYGATPTSATPGIALRSWRVELSDVPEKQRRGLAAVLEISQNFE